jgi:hypothetical protein
MKAVACGRPKESAMRFLAAFLAGAALLASAPAAAQLRTPDEQCPAGGANVPTRTITGDECAVPGTLTRPPGDWVPGHRKPKFDSLIKLRSAFGRELSDSTDKL